MERERDVQVHHSPRLNFSSNDFINYHPTHLSLLRFKIRSIIIVKCRSKIKIDEETRCSIGWLLVDCPDSKQSRRSWYLLYLLYLHSNHHSLSTSKHIPPSLQRKLIMKPKLFQTSLRTNKTQKTVLYSSSTSLSCSPRWVVVHFDLL